MASEAASGLSAGEVGYRPMKNQADLTRAALALMAEEDEARNAAAERFVWRFFVSRWDLSRYVAEGLQHPGDYVCLLRARCTKSAMTALTHAPIGRLASREKERLFSIRIHVAIVKLAASPTKIFRKLRIRDSETFCCQGQPCLLVLRRCDLLDGDDGTDFPYATFVVPPETPSVAVALVSGKPVS